MVRSGLAVHWAVAASALVLLGCQRRPFVYHDVDDHYRAVATEIEYPDADIAAAPSALETPRPPSVRQPMPQEVWELGLEEAVRIALGSSQVIRSLGGRVISAPASVASVYDPALAESDPVAGVEAALSAFDAQLATTLFFDRNERTFNNFFLAGGVGGLWQNVANMRTSISKQSAAGTQFAFRSITDYDRNNVPIPPNRFASVYNTVLEAEVRQPLLQGAGLAFNRIAGPNAQPGVYRGVVLGRINTDLSLADFEAAVRDFLVEVETTYWQLYFAYRDLDAKIAARDAALETWRAVRDRLNAGLPGADGEREALAREQYFTAQAEVDNALSSTATSGLVVTTFGGVYTVERQLRYLLGLPLSDGRLIRPRDEPVTVDVTFDWTEAVAEALARRVELRKQKWVIRRRQLELSAARNFLHMRLDTVAQYRWRGFGDNLFGSRDRPNGSAFDDLFGGDLQEWRLGVELSTPIGNRIGHVAVRNAQWQVARETALYRQQERQVVRELSRAFVEIDRAYQVTRANYNRSVASFEQLRAVEVKYQAGESLLEFVIDAQRRATEASSIYYRSLVEYSLAIMNVHLARGTLLDFNNVYLTEGRWSAWAHRSAGKQASRFRQSLNYSYTLPANVSRGPYDQRAGSAAEDLDGDPRPPSVDRGIENLPEPAAPTTSG